MLSLYIFVKQTEIHRYTLKKHHTLIILDTQNNWMLRADRECTIVLSHIIYPFLLYW